MGNRSGILVLAGLAVAWMGTARGELSVGWAGGEEGVAKASVAVLRALEEAADGEPEAPNDEAGIAREEYLAVARAAADEAAVDELSRQMVDGMFGGAADGLETEYGESSLPGGNDGEARLAGMLATRGVAGRTVPGGGWTGAASDNSGNAVYARGQDWMGLNGGEGFGAWREGSGSAAPAVRAISGDGGFRVQANEQSGEMAMVRDLNTDVGLTSGTFEVTVWGADGGADEPGDFSGFAVYGANDSELFRWGFRLADGGDEPFSTFSYSLNGGKDYTVIQPGYPAAGVDYTLTWGVVGGRTQFTLSAQANGVEGMDPYFSGYSVSLETSERVMAIAALLTESGSYAAGGNGSEMTFDNLRVTGVEPAVPEPGGLGLLAAGAAVLAGRRKTKRKG